MLAVSRPDATSGANMAATAGGGETCAARYKGTGDEWAAPVAQRSRRAGTGPINRHADPAGVAIPEKMENDIVTRLRQTRADMIGTDDEDHYFDCHEAAAEIQRLRQWGRLTDAERFVLREVCAAYADRDDVKCNEIAAVIDGLLARL